MFDRARIARQDCPCGTLAPAAPFRIDPRDLDALYGGRHDGAFVLAVSPRIAPDVVLVTDPDRPARRYLWTGPESRAGLVRLMAECRRDHGRVDVLWVGDDEFEHFQPDELNGARLAAISFFSGGYSAEALARYLGLARDTPYAAQLCTEERLFDLLDRADAVVFRSPSAGAEVVFDHRRGGHWFSMHGPLAYGQQIVLPTGELAVLADPSGVHTDAGLALDGAVVLRGMPVVHRGGRDVSPTEAAAAFAALRVMADWPAVVTIRGGVIREVASPTPGENPFAAALLALFRADERYRKVQEVGFGTNVLCGELVAQNDFPNERFPGVHFGLGLGGFTRLHIDLVCPAVDVLCQMHDGGEVNLYHSALHSMRYTLRGQE